jgi:hypothetical protein
MNSFILWVSLPKAPGKTLRNQVGRRIASLFSNFLVLMRLKAGALNGERMSLELLEAYMTDEIENSRPVFSKGCLHPHR